MNESEPQRRHSIGQLPDLITNDDEKAIAESRNGILQFDAGIATIQTALEQKNFKLRPSLILSLHRYALSNISHFAGNYRPGGVSIQNSSHIPPGAHQVPEYVEELCDYVNEKWDQSTAVHLAAFVMWRLNWIHPFDDGNGRTSRTTSYVVLSIKGELELPGKPTIPDLIVGNRVPYFEAIEAADAIYKAENRFDVTLMESLIGGLLAQQLASVWVGMGADVQGTDDR